jgi:hypothetical protein
MIASELPKIHGERHFAENVKSIINNDNHWIWFNLQIPRAGMSKEVDALIYSKIFKIFIVIEIKGFQIDHISKIQKGKLILNSGEQRENPWEQASDNAKKLKSAFDYHMRINQLKISKKIFCSPVVALPLISRNEFAENFVENSKENEYLKEMLEATLFSDDFITDKIFNTKLKNSLEHPVYSSNFVKNTENSICLNDIELKSISKILFPEIKSKYNKTYDDKVVKDIEASCLKILNDISTSHPLLIEGYAGTGKTFVGFNLARKLASSGKKILFTCYNKTLATDLNRIKNNEPVFRNDPMIKENLMIKDIFEILVDLKRIFPDVNNVMTSINENVNKQKNDVSEDNSLSSYDKWAINIIEKVLVSNNMHEHLYKYDYIIADETQDFKPYMFDLIELLVNENKDIAYIFGKSQVLYVDNENVNYKGVSSIKETLKTQNKNNILERRRVFRTTDMSFLIAQSYLECFPRHSNAIDFISKYVKKPKNDNLSFDFDCDRKGGNVPKLIYSDGDPKHLENNIIKTLTEIFNRNKDLNGVDSDVMILIPTKEYLKTPLINCLTKLNKKFIDYSEDHNKRIQFYDDEVRICTYYSSRGLEANFILVLGFNYFEIPIKERGQENIVSDLGYIVLSRAIYDTYLLSIKGEKERQLEFLENVIDNFKI